jgi:formiminotetrahydrofolate cyclodeaminase
MSLDVITGIAAIVAAVSAGIFLMVRSIKRGAARSGRQEKIIEHQRGAIDAIAKAKQVEEAARSGADREWAERVRRKYRRP